jgi:hypothetical protein
MEFSVITTSAPLPEYRRHTHTPSIPQPLCSCDEDARAPIGEQLELFLNDILGVAVLDTTASFSLRKWCCDSCLVEALVLDEWESAQRAQLASAPSHGIQELSEFLAESFVQGPRNSLCA